MSNQQDNHIANFVRLGTAVGMSWSGIAYLLQVYRQQMYPPTVILRGFRNPAFRYLCAFFGLATAQQTTVNVVSNPEARRLLNQLRQSGEPYTGQIHKEPTYEDEL